MTLEQRVQDLEAGGLMMLALINALAVTHPNLERARSEALHNADLAETGLLYSDFPGRAAPSVRRTMPQNRPKLGRCEVIAMFMASYGLLIELLALGQYEVEKGRFVNFDVHDLSRMADAYNKQRATRRAPLVIGHPDKDADAKAWIEHLQVIDRVLFGYVKDFASETFIAGLNDKTYTRYQASFWGPEHPENPSPGSWMLKHVGVLGPPLAAMRGPLISEATFTEHRTLQPELRFGTGGCIEFAEFPIAPASAADLAQRARAVMVFFDARGERISATQAVAFASAGFSAADHAAGLRQGATPAT